MSQNLEWYATISGIIAAFMLAGDFGRRITGWQHHRWSAVVTLVLVSVWFVVRNLPFVPFTGLYV